MMTGEPSDGSAPSYRALSTRPRRGSHVVGPLTANQELPMKKTKHRTKKLTLSRDTLRSLQNVELQKVVGGFSDVLGGTTCYPAECNIDSDPCP